MSFKENIKNKFNIFLEKQVSKNKKAADLSFLNDLEEDIVYEEGEKKEKSLKEQMQGLEAPKVKQPNKFLYYINNFYKKLYFLEYKNYKTGEILRWKVRGSSKREASENAKLIYNLDHEPDNLKTFSVSQGINC